MADNAFTTRLVRRIMRAGALQVRPLIPSSTLRRALRRVLISPTQGALFIPHYWAVYLHDGRAGFSAKRGSFLIFWRDHKKDPRLLGNQTPERASQLRRLTSAQFRAAVKEFNSARAAGRTPEVIITRSVGPVRADLFFANEGRGGMVGFVFEANDVGQFEFRTFALGFLRRPLGLSTFIPQIGQAGITLPTIKETAVLRI